MFSLSSGAKNLATENSNPVYHCDEFTVIKPVEFDGIAETFVRRQKS